MKYLIVFLILVFVEVYALYSLKKQNLIRGIIGFIIVAILLYYLLKDKHIGIVNHTWNLFSSLIIFLIGYLYFFEKLSNIQIVGIIAGLIGLLLAVILSAAMSSSASGLTALASTTAIDIDKRNVRGEKSEKHYVNATRYFTLLWGVIAILFACVGTLFENLIQLVNIVGSIFYGTVLGVFLVGFYIKYVKANAIFYSAVISQITIFFIYYYTIHIYPTGQEKLGYLWLNFIGASLTVLVSIIFQICFRDKQKIIA